MKAALNFLKQLGATIIVLFLVAMMALTFSSQPLDEILTVLSGGSRVGSFNGEQMSDDAYAYADNICRDQFRQFPNIPDMFLAQCIEGRLKELYILPAIAENLGRKASKEEIEMQLVEQAKAEFSRQAINTLEEDRLSLKQIYQRQVQMVPVDLRVRLASAQQAANTLYSDIKLPEDYTNAMLLAETTLLNMNLIRYSEVDLLSKIDGQVDPLLTGKERTEAKQKMLSERKSALGKLKGDSLSLNAVQEITGIRPVVVNGLPVAGLSAAQLPGGITADLAAADFLLELSGPGTYGPYQDGQNTFYVEISSVNRRQAQVTPEQAEQKYSLDILRSFSEYIINQEAERGDFKTVVGRQAAPEISNTN